MLNQLRRKLFAEITSTPDVLKPNRLPGLDGLRAIAIIVVIISHYVMDTSYELSVRGEIGVKIFFVLSGFLITTLLLKERLKNRTISLRRFYIRRFLRIMPVVFLYLAVLLVLNYLLHLGLGPAPFFTSLFFLQNFPLPLQGSWYVRHFWSLSIEEQFYLTFPFLLVYSLNKYIRVTICLIVGVSVIALLGYNKVGVFYTNNIVHKTAFAIVNLWGETVGILIGSLTSILLFKGIITVKNNLFTRYIGIAIFIIAVLIHTDSFIWSWKYSTLFLFPMMIAAVIVLNLNTSSFFTKILELKPIKYIGVISYSLYMWQQLFARKDISILHTNSLLLRLTIIFAAGAISYHFYESFFIRKKAKFEAIKTDA